MKTIFKKNPDTGKWRGFGGGFLADGTPLPPVVPDEYKDWEEWTGDEPPTNPVKKDKQTLIREEFFKLPGALQDKYEDLIITGRYYIEHGQFGRVMGKLNAAKARQKADPRETDFIAFVEQTLRQP